MNPSNLMTDTEFQQLVKEGIDSLPEWVRANLVNVVFIIEDAPSALQRKENNLRENETLFGLYEGVPRTERGDSSPEMPDRITIFKSAILEAYADPKDIQACVGNTIWHEVAHYFGHDEDWVSIEEVRRGKLL